MVASRVTSVSTFVTRTVAAEYYCPVLSDTVPLICEVVCPNIDWTVSSAIKTMTADKLRLNIVDSLSNEAKRFFADCSTRIRECSKMVLWNHGYQVLLQELTLY